MGLFGFAESLIKATVKVVVTPVAIVADVTGITEEATIRTLESAAEDVEKSFDKLTE